MVFTSDFSPTFQEPRLCEDAQAFDAEARRRVRHWQANQCAFDGNRI